jgi:hypothetical protein
MKGWLLIPLALLCSACGNEETPAVKEAPQAASGDVLKLEGPGGIVTLGDSLDIAKKAFPAPEKAQIMPRAMNFAIVTNDGWSWMKIEEERGFEAAAKDGKVIGLVLTSIKPDPEEPAKTIAKIGQPTRKAEGKTAKLYVWESGDHARFWMTAKTGLIDLGSITMIGAKEDMKLLNYRADDPGTFVKQMDAASEQVKSSELEPAFKEAKRKALEKLSKDK